MSGTTSGTYSWDLTAQEIIYGALRLLSAIESGEVPPANEYEDALAALNGLIKQWQGSGIHLWTEADCTLFLQPNQAQYSLGANSSDHACLTQGSLLTTLSATALAAATTVTLTSVAGIAAGSQVGIWLDAGMVFWTTALAAPVGNVVTLAAPLPSQATSGAYAASYASALVRPLRVPAGRLVFLQAQAAQLIEVPLMPMSRLYYASVPDKYVPGTVTQYFFDPQMGQGLMNVWPAPSSSATVLRFTAQLPIQDIGNSPNIAQLPQEWIACLRFNLAKELALEYDCPAPRLQAIAAMAAEKFAMAAAWDREPESGRFGVAGYPQQRN